MGVRLAAIVTAGPPLAPLAAHGHPFAVYFDASKNATITGKGSSLRFTNPQRTIVLEGAEFFPRTNDRGLRLTAGQISPPTHGRARSLPRTHA